MGSPNFTLTNLACWSVRPQLTQRIFAWCLFASDLVWCPAMHGGVCSSGWPQRGCRSRGQVGAAPATGGAGALKGKGVLSPFHSRKSFDL
jgi:hypothetical protein